MYRPMSVIKVKKVFDIKMLITWPLQMSLRLGNRFITKKIFIKAEEVLNRIRKT